MVDASAMVLALSDRTDRGDAARARLFGGEDLHAPHLIDLEFASSMRKSAARGRLPGDDAEEAIAELVSLPLRRYEHAWSLPRLWELRENLTPYDAAYAALAEALRCSLVTADRSFAGAPGVRCEVELLTA